MTALSPYMLAACPPAISNPSFTEIYGVEVSPTFISQVTNAVMEEVTAWQSWPLDAVNPIVYLALGVNMDGEKELLGLWMAQTEGAKFWL